jgi:hypothetical protein
MSSAYHAMAVRRPMSWPVVVASIAAAVAGVLAVPVVDPRERPARPESGGVLRAGVASLPLAAGWEPARRSTIPGLEHAASARTIFGELSLDVRTPDHPSLLPAALLDGVGLATARPAPASAGSRRAWAYDLPGSRSRIVALVLPTTEGVVTIACAGDESFAAELAFECEDALAALRLDGAALLRPTAETAARTVVGPAISVLDEVRSTARRELASTRSPAARARAARRIAAAYEAAHRRLDPLARGDATPLPRELAALARAHRALAAASAKRDARAAARAGRAIERRERLLASRLRAGPD